MNSSPPRFKEKNGKDKQPSVYEDWPHHQTQS